MTAQTSAQRLFMDNVYEYDKVNNILSLKNNAPIPTSNLMGGASEYNYSYDDLYRLTEATGSFRGSNHEHQYTLSMSYNSVGSILHKNQVHKRKGYDETEWAPRNKTTYEQEYAYSEAQPHAPVHIGRQTFTYDANGNQTGWTDDISGQRRRIMWDEENRIRAIYDNGALYHYVYDASGERVLKGQALGQRVFVNGEQKAGSGQVGNYTVYVNPYLVLKSGGYTKHYYIEGQRIVSKLGGGWDNDGKGPLKAGGDKIDYNGKTQKVFDGLVKNLKFLGADGQILTAGKSGKIPPGQLNGQGGGGGGTSTSESFRYFYHPDHLGSTSYITDASGEVYQHLEYFAFGETFVEEHSNANRTPYLFNGKELDEETGLYYYGARYYDARTSVWLSVDPHAESYASISSYVYAANNPMIFTDPDGRDIDLGNLYEKDQDGKYLHERQIKAFENFASTKTGKDFIMKRAQIGFKLEGAFVKDLKIEAESAGELSGKVDANFKVTNLDTYETTKNIRAGAAGLTEAQINDNGKLSVTYHMHSERADFFQRYGTSTEIGAQELLKSVNTWAHETLIHGYSKERNYFGGKYQGMKGAVPHDAGNEHAASFVRQTPYYRNINNMLNSIDTKYKLGVSGDYIWRKIIFHGY